MQKNNKSKRNKATNCESGCSFPHVVVQGRNIQPYTGLCSWSNNIQNAKKGNQSRRKTHHQRINKFKKTFKKRQPRQKEKEKHSIVYLMYSSGQNYGYYEFLRVSIRLWCNFKSRFVITIQGNLKADSAFNIYSPYKLLGINQF